RAGSTEQRASRTCAAVASSMVATAYAHRLLATKSVRKNASAPPETRAAASAVATRTRLNTAASQLSTRDADRSVTKVLPDLPGTGRSRPGRSVLLPASAAAP